MSSRRNHYRVAATLISMVTSFVVATGCAGTTTTIEQSWAAYDIGHQFHHVVALYDAQDGAIRRSAEDRLVRMLATQGVSATPSYAILSGNEQQHLDVAKLKARAAGYDGLVAMRVIDKTENVEVTPGFGWDYGGFGGYWGYGGGWPYYDPYVYTELVVRVETTAYSLVDNKLVWSAVSKTVDPGNTNDLVNGVTNLVAIELSRRGVVVATRPPIPISGTASASATL